MWKRVEARGKAVGSLTGSVVDRVGALTGSGHSPSRGVDRVWVKNGSCFDRVGPETGRVLTGHDDVIMTSAPGN